MNDCESVIQVSGDGRKDSVGMSDYLNLSNGVSGSHSVEYLAAVAHDSAHIQYFKKCNIKPIFVNSGVSCVAIADMKRSPRFYVNGNEILKAVSCSICVLFLYLIDK